MLQKLKQHLSRKQSIAHTGIVLNYKKYLKARKGSPRALVSYLTSPVVNDLNNEPEIMFSNRGIARSIPRALNELGYVVDVVNYDNTTAQLPQRYYDLLIQHGAVNYDYVKAALKPGGVLIYFSSGSYWKFHNDSETKRFQNLARRTKSTLSPDRLIELSEEQVNSEANGIIALGNAGVRATYKKFSSVFSLNLACYPDAHFDTFKKDHARSRSNFLFFAGGGNVHKGLDLVVEAFTQLDQHLYIVTHIEDGFRQVYREQLSSPNIHVIGSLQMRTEQY